jgi:hypothetical protein
MTEVQAIVALQAVMKGDVAAGHERLKWVASTGTREGIAVDLARCELRDRTFSRFAPAQAAKRDEATSAAEQGPISRTAAYPPSSIAGYRAPRQRPYAGQSLNSIDVPKVEESELGSVLDALPDVDDVLKAFETDPQRADEKQIEAK